jgi:glycosyltransferase involved in cell wall biosynthesis
MASGLPVVAAAAGGVPSVIGRPGVAGILFPPGDADAAARSLRKLWGNPEARCARQRACGRRALAFPACTLAPPPPLAPCSPSLRSPHPHPRALPTLPPPPRRRRMSRAARAEMSRWSWRHATMEILREHYPAALAAARAAAPGSPSPPLLAAP